MTFSVGILYSAQTLLEVVESGGVDSTNLGVSFSKISVADAGMVLVTSQKCRWLRIDEDGKIRLTERGAHLRALTASTDCLREQLYDVILSDPPAWSRRMIQGRFEALKSMPDYARQCFEDCELIDGTEESTVAWWDRTTSSLRSERSRALHQVGREAEKMTLKFEKRRTGLDPVWQAFETSVSGFDVLSVVDSASTMKLKIEVKGSRMRKSEASFFVTRNEWDTATRSTQFSFHLWLVHEQPKLFVVPASDVGPHIPLDSGSGRWHNAELYFRDFSDFEHNDAK